MWASSRVSRPQDSGLSSRFGSIRAVLADVNSSSKSRVHPHTPLPSALPFTGSWTPLHSPLYEAAPSPLHSTLDFRVLSILTTRAKTTDLGAGHPPSGCLIPIARQAGFRDIRRLLDLAIPIRRSRSETSFRLWGQNRETLVDPSK